MPPTVTVPVDWLTVIAIEADGSATITLTLNQSVVAGVPATIMEDEVTRQLEEQLATTLRLASAAQRGRAVGIRQ